jgi:hypothetical protein
LPLVCSLWFAASRYCTLFYRLFPHLLYCKNVNTIENPRLLFWNLRFVFDLAQAVIYSVNTAGRLQPPVSNVQRSQKAVSAE